MGGFTYSHDKGLGEHHAAQAGRELPAEMRELDMAPGTEVVHEATDESNGFVIVSWRDKGGVPRNTAIEPGFFAEHFTADAGNSLAGHAKLSAGVA